jgi:outer membrane biogenesis lipoprotein LolB
MVGAVSVRFAVVVAVVCFILLGCATNSSKSANEARMWREQLLRQQLVAREAGRIGYIGNAGPALGSTLPSGHGR